MFKIRKLKARDFIIIVTFALLQSIDFVWTLVNFEREMNPVALWLGKEGFILWKAVVTFAVLFIYVLNIFPLKWRKVLEIVAIGFSLIPVIFIIFQIITLLV